MNTHDNGKKLKFAFHKTCGQKFVTKTTNKHKFATRGTKDKQFHKVFMFVKGLK